jgi:hypothetical protein
MQATAQILRSVTCMASAAHSIKCFLLCITILLHDARAILSYTVAIRLLKIMQGCIDQSDTQAYEGSQAAADMGAMTICDSSDDELTPEKVALSSVQSHATHSAGAFQVCSGRTCVQNLFCRGPFLKSNGI